MSIIRKAIITAAGRGTRQYPASKTVQKELFPLVDTDGFAKPTLQIIAEECIAGGIEEICIVANPQNVDAIQAHFSNPTLSERALLAGKDWAVKLAGDLGALAGHIHMAVQTKQEGFGHAVYQAREWAGNDPVLVLLGDHVYLPNDGAPKCSKQMIDAFAKFDAPVSSVEIVTEKSVARLGVLKCEPLEPGPYKVLDIVEKPSVEEARANLRTPGLADGEYLAHFGIHAFPNLIFDKLKYLIDHDIRRKDEYQLTSAQELLVNELPLYVAQRIQGHRYDMGQPDEFIATQIALTLASPRRDWVRKLLQ